MLVLRLQQKIDGDKFCQKQRITSQKCLITLEPAISVNQTNEMLAQNLQLVIPTIFKGNFTASQQVNFIKPSRLYKRSPPTTK
jgi:hypothetical protein